MSHLNPLVRYMGRLAFGAILLFGLYRSWAFRDHIFKLGPEPGVYAKLNQLKFMPAYDDVIIVVRATRDPYLEFFFECKGINISPVEFKKYVSREWLNKISGGYPIKMICIVESKPLNELPVGYSKFLPKFINHTVISDNPESGDYYNFFWNN